MGSPRTVIALLQLLMVGSLVGQSDFLVMTPDPAVNQQIKGQAITELDLLQYAEGGQGLTLNPQLPPHWTWIAGRGTTSNGQPVEFFFRNGIMFATDVEVCSFRNRKYGHSFTDRIQSNTFTIGIRHDREAVIFVATEEPKEVRLVVDASVFGEEKVIEFPLGNSESQLIRIFPLKEPYRP
ncbi:MAG: hypothetical protein JSW54_10470 [Fidelibacterota bacterium]|nr:MAG: hypothetical protein JSW54_10470 [Candidatus Neomarinimicrobiota bacterium]